MTMPYYQDDACAIYHGDCLDLSEDVLANVVAVLTDPPYNVGKGYGVHKDRMEEDAYLGWLRDRFAHVSVNAVNLLWFWMGTRVAKGQARACLPDGFQIHHLAAWFKREFAGDLWVGGHPAATWEPIVWAARGGGRYCGPKGGHGARDCIVANHPRHDVGNNGHPCPKPLSVMRHVVAWVADVGETIVDPFMGSGTTLRAAKDTGRKAIGVDVDERYCEIAALRLAQGALALEGAVAE